METLLYIIGWLLWIAFGTIVAYIIIAIWIAASMTLWKWRLDRKGIAATVKTIRQREEALK